MVDIFARRSKVATLAIGLADVLTPVQVRVFSDCEMRWFYQHLLAVPDPPTASMALDTGNDTSRSRRDADHIGGGDAGPQPC